MSVMSGAKGEALPESQCLATVSRPTGEGEDYGCATSPRAVVAVEPPVHRSRECADRDRNADLRAGRRRANYQNRDHHDRVADVWRVLVAWRRAVRKDRRQGVRRGG